MRTRAVSVAGSAWQEGEGACEAGLREAAVSH